MPIKPKAKRLNSEKNISWSSTNFDYASTIWRKLRAWQLRKEPLCRDCKKDGKLTPATVADHIKPISKGGAEYDEDNLQSLCESCHNSKTIKENK